MDQPPRICQTCRHFQQSPLSHKGWCRNPILYTERDQHLVAAHGVDCARAYGDLWEPSSSAIVAPPPVAPQRLSPIHELLPGLSRLRPPSARTIVGSCLAMTLAVILGLNAGWPVGASPAEPPPTEPLRSVVTVSPLVTPSATPTPRPSPSATPTATASPTPTALPTATPTQPPTPTATQPSAPEATPSLPVLVTVTAPPSSASSSLQAGDIAIVRVTSDPPRLRLRQAAGLDHSIIGRVNSGKSVRIIGGPSNADGYVWWKVESGTVTGWAAAPFLEAVPATSP